jgi:signal transduction histidine kinase
MGVQISLPVAVSGVSCLLAAYVALSLIGFFRLSRWGQHRLFVLVATTASVFCGIDSLVTLELPVSLHQIVGRLHILSAGLNVAVWLRYCASELGPLRHQRAIERIPVAAALLSWLPVVSMTGRTRAVPVPWLGVVLHTTEMTLFGSAMLIVLALGLALVALRYLRGALQRKPYALVHLLALSIFAVCALNDVLATAGVLHTPHLADAGISLCICVVGVALTQRWSADIRALDELSASLERKVAARTSQLESTLAALNRADRLTAVGRLAGGMAHEINNPGAALIANVEYLLDGVRRGEMPSDLKETLEESLQAARRISSTVRQLLLVGRAATADTGDATFNLAFVVRQAVLVVERQHGNRVPIVRRIPEDIVARGRGLLLEQILVHLISNAVQSVPAQNPDGQVRVAAECDDGVVVLRVIDNGVGMNPAVCERIFEPFFTTRPAGQGAGLGLAVSLGLLQALGGEVRVESNPGKGTTMTLVLDAIAGGAAKEGVEKARAAKGGAASSGVEIPLPVPAGEA